MEVSLNFDNFVSIVKYNMSYDLNLKILISGNIWCLSQGELTASATFVREGLKIIFYVYFKGILQR